MRIVLYLAPLVLALYCLIDAIGSRDDEVRNLSKVWWIVLVLFFPFVGSIAWLVAGRPEDKVSRRSPYERETPHFPEYDRPGRAAATDPEKDDEFLQRVRERAESQRKAYEAQRKREREADGEAGDQEVSRAWVAAARTSTCARRTRGSRAASSSSVPAAGRR